MSGTVIDALVVMLGLDAKPFVEGQKQADKAVDSNRKTVEEWGQSTLKTAQNVKAGVTSAMAALHDKVVKPVLSDAGVRQGGETVAKRVSATWDRITTSARTMGERISTAVKNGTAAIGSAYRKLEEELDSGTRKTGDNSDKRRENVEDNSKRTVDSLNQMTRAFLTLFAVVTAGKGLKEFFQESITDSAIVGRLSKNLDENIRELSAWRNVARLTGGTADGMSGSMENLVQEFQQFTLTGQSSVIPYFRALGINIANADGSMRNMSDLFLDLADRFSKMDPARAQAFGRAMGLDPATINTLVLGRKAVQELLDEQIKLGTVTEADAAAAIRLQRSMGEVQQASESLGRAMITRAEPYLRAFADRMRDFFEWLQQHTPLMTAFFSLIGAAAVALGIRLAILAAAFLGISAPVAIAIAAIVALIATLALLYDDWKSWTQGGKSLFGEMFDGIAKSIKDFTAIIVAAWKLIKDIFTGNFSAIAGDMKQLFGAAFDELQDGMKTLLGGVHGVVHLGTGVWKWATEGEKPDTTTAAGDAAAPSTASTAKPSGVNEEAWNAAVASQEKYGIPAKVTYAQWALESGYGHHMPAGSNNPFGIKARAGEPFVLARTQEELANGQHVSIMARFRKFDSIAQAFEEHAKLLNRAGAYAEARKHRDDPRAFANALTGHYATEHSYGADLNKIIDGLNAATPAAPARPTGPPASAATSGRGARGGAPAGGNAATRSNSGGNDRHPAGSAADKPPSVAVTALSALAKGLGDLMTYFSGSKAAAAKKAPPAPQTTPPAGAKIAAKVSTSTTRTATTNHSETHIGQVNVKTQATDAKGIARDIKPALRNAGLASQANTGHV